MSRKKRPEHSNHERWLVSYADFITLLFAFFVVLYSSPQVDQRKAGKLAKAIQTAFAQMGAFDSTSTRPQVLKPEDPSLSNFRAIQEGHAFETLKGGQPASVPDMKQIQKDLQASLAREISARTVSVTATREGIVVSLRELGFFDSGSPLMKTTAMPVLDRIASILAVRTCGLRIEGHTDDVPIHTAQMASNWELSTARATELVRLLILRYRFSPQRLSAAGFAQYHPIASNATVQGRAQNRRVDVVILNVREGRGNLAAESAVPAKPSPARP